MSGLPKAQSLCTLDLFDKFFRPLLTLLYSWTKGPLRITSPRQEASGPSFIHLPSLSSTTLTRFSNFTNVAKSGAYSVCQELPLSPVGCGLPIDVVFRRLSSPSNLSRGLDRASRPNGPHGRTCRHTGSLWDGSEFAVGRCPTPLDNCQVRVHLASTSRPPRAAHPRLSHAYHIPSIRLYAWKALNVRSEPRCTMRPPSHSASTLPRPPHGFFAIAHFRRRIYQTFSLSPDARVDLPGS